MGGLWDKGSGLGLEDRRWKWFQ